MNPTKINIDRYKEALRIRESGATYKEVGLRLNPPVAPQRAGQIVSKAIRLREKGWPRRRVVPGFDGLSTQHANALKGMGFESREQVRQAFLDGRLLIVKSYGLFLNSDECACRYSRTNWGIRINGISYNRARTIAEWAGVPPTKHLAVGMHSRQRFAVAKNTSRLEQLIHETERATQA